MRIELEWLIFVAGIATVASYTVSRSQDRQLMSDLVLANVEALANGEYSQKIWERYNRPEGDGYNCTKTGSQSCF